MKSRVLDVMGDVLGLVKRSDLGGATALIRKALSGETAPDAETGKGPCSVEQGPLPVSPLKGAPPPVQDGVDHGGILVTRGGPGQPVQGPVARTH